MTSRAERERYEKDHSSDNPQPAMLRLTTGVTLTLGLFLLLIVTVVGCCG